MVSSRAKTPSGAAEAIPMPTEMDSRVVENERRMVAMVGRTVETASHRERGKKKGSACKHCLSGRGKSTCP